MTETTKYRIVPIKGMHCKSCEIVTEEELAKVPGVKKVDVDHRSGRATVWYKGAEPDEEAVCAAVCRAGYGIGKEERPWLSRDASTYLEASVAAVLVGAVFLVGRDLGWFDISLGTAERLGSLPFVFVVGLTAGISTCMAIVGGLVLAVSARFSEKHPDADAGSKFLPHVYFNVGRIGGFALLGGLLGLLGSTIQPSALSVGILTAFVALVMVLLGLQLLELFPGLSAWKVTLPKGIAQLLGVRTRSKKEYSHGRAAFLGAITFFLPCGFTQAVQLFVVTQGEAWLGAITMGVFALGTAPGLLGIGGISSVAKGAFGRYFFKTAGVVVVALGVFNLQNGLSLLGLGQTQSVVSETGEAAEQPSVPERKEPQIIRMDQLADGYEPNEFTVKRGQPVRWVIDSKESYSCAVSLVSPKLGVKKILKPGENVIEFTPKSAGDIPFSCSMGMYRGIIHVTE